MSFSVEVPGEAAPLNPGEVLKVLQAASSSNQHLIHSGTKQLQTWETQRGYYPLLQTAYIDTSLPTEIRYLAIIQLKNGIDKYWRKSATNPIDAEEKAALRSQLLPAGVAEVEPLLALQTALAISKIVRIDYPGDWPDALSNLIYLIREASDTNQFWLQRGLLILRQVIKELSTARIRRSQTSLQAATPELVFLLGAVYSGNVQTWLNFMNGEGGEESSILGSMSNSLSALKILRRLLVAGYEHPNHDTDVQRLWSQSQQHFGQFLSLLDLDSVPAPVREFIEKHLLQFSKFHVEMSDIHPAAFALLPNSIDLTRAYWGLIESYGDKYSTTQPLSEEGGGNTGRNFQDRLSLKGLVLLRHCIRVVFSPQRSFKYKTPESKEEDKSATQLLRSQLLTDDLVRQIANVVVTKFFVFRKADLDAWEDEPDEWEIREEGGGDTWEFEVRPCSEKLFMDLVLNFKQLLMQPLLGFFDSVTGSVDSNVIVKDSVYTAMGLSAAVVYHEFDFDTFLSSTLVKDVQQSGESFKILRRRIAILIGQWITVKCAPEKRPLIYQIFQHLLNSNDQTNDQVVRVTAARQLKAVVDDFQFEAKDFLPFAEAILGQLMALIQEVDHVETKMAVLETIRTVSVRLELEIIPYADQIVSMLPALWESSGEEHLMKQAVLTLLSTLTTAMGEKSARYHALILPLIHKAIHDPEMQVYLLEESLELWSTILQQATVPASPDLVALADSVFPLLELGSDNLRMVLVIVESYVFLAPEAMLVDDTRLRIFSYMTNLLGVSKRDLAGLVISIVENLILVAARLGGNTGVQVVVKDLIESGFTERIVSGLHDAYTAHQTTGPNRRYPTIDDVVETDYFTILARIALADASTFASLLESLGELSTTFDWLVTEWFRHFDSMASPERTKLSCLALTNLLALPPPITPLILTKLQDYFAMWTMVVSELQDPATGEDTLVWSTEDNEYSEYETAEDVRKREQSSSDAIHMIVALPWIKEKLSELAAIIGGQEILERECLSVIDKDVIEGFRKLDSPILEME